MKLFYKTLLAFDALALGFIVCVSAKEPKRLETDREQERMISHAESYEPEASSEPERCTIRMKVTAYCPGECCCGRYADGVTSINDNAWVCDGVAAAPKLLAYRTRLFVPVAGEKEVDDTGGAMRQSAKEGIYHIDLRFPTHAQALEWGIQWLDVTILNGALCNALSETQ